MLSTNQLDIWKNAYRMNVCLSFALGNSCLSKTESLSKRSMLINLSTSSSHSSSLQKQTKEIEHHQIINFK